MLEELSEAGCAWAAVEGEWAPAGMLLGCPPRVGQGSMGRGCANASRKGGQCLRDWKVT